MSGSPKKIGIRSWIAIEAFITIGSLVAAANTVLVLEPEDRISKSRGTWLTFLGFVFFISLFDMLNVLALRTTPGNRLRQQYALTEGEVMDINNKVVSAVQALLCVVTGAVVCCWSCTRDFMRSSHYMSEAYAWFGAAYFFYDIWSMYRVHVQMSHEKPTLKARTAKSSNGNALSHPLCVKARQLYSGLASFITFVKDDPIILMHHLFIGGFGFLVIVYLRGDLGDCVFGFAYLMELSTPFVSLRGVLSRLNLKKSGAYVVNGLLMLVTFLLCRIISLPYATWLYSRAKDLSYIEAVKSLPRGCKISILILLLPQFYWFYLMSRGAVKVFLGGGDKRTRSGGDCKEAEKVDKRR